jgi:acyl dehydratase
MTVFWDDVREGQTLPALTVQVTYKMAIMHVAAGWDYMPGHHEPDYAKSQGQETIFLNTLFHQSMVDRVMTDWAGPRGFIARRKLSMKGAIYPGDILTGEAKITRRYEADGKHRLDLNITLSNQTHICATAEATLILPVRDVG